MDIKRILVPLTGSDGDHATLTTAILVAVQFGSHLEIVYQAVPAVSDRELERAFGNMGMARYRDFVDTQRSNREDKSHHTRHLFDELTETHGVAHHDNPIAAARPSASWREIETPVAEVVGHDGGVCDLIVVGRPADIVGDPGKTVVGAALFASGRPVLVAPPTAPERLDRRVMIAWNRSIQSGRAVAGAMPFLHRSGDVLVLSLTTGAKQGASAPDLARYLALHDIEPRVREIPPNGRAVGDVLLSECAQQEAGLLVMGAYSHSRVREMLLGGVTRHVLAHAEVPLLMVH